LVVVKAGIEPRATLGALQGRQPRGGCCTDPPKPYLRLVARPCCFHFPENPVGLKVPNTPQQRWKTQLGLWPRLCHAPGSPLAAPRPDRCWPCTSIFLLAQASLRCSRAAALRAKCSRRLAARSAALAASGWHPRSTAPLGEGPSGCEGPRRGSRSMRSPKMGPSTKQDSAPLVGERWRPSRRPGWRCRPSGPPPLAWRTPRRCMARRLLRLSRARRRTARSLSASWQYCVRSLSRARRQGFSVARWARRARA